MRGVPAQSTAVLVLGLFISGVAQTPNSRLSGRITDWSGCPLQGAKVTVASTTGGTSATGITDAAGYYEIRGVPLGRVVISAELLGFKDVRVEAALFSGSTQWDTGLNLGRLVDTPPHRIAGVVTGTDGRPVANARISLWNAFSPDRLAQSVSDKDGRFALETMDAGEFIVSVVAANYRAAARVVSCLLYTSPSPRDS